LELLEYGTFLGRISAKDFKSADMFWMGWTDFNNEAMGRLPRNLHSNGALSWQNDKVLDEMIDQANAIVDPKAREVHMQRLFTHVYDNPPAIFLWTTDEAYAMRNNIDWEPRAKVSWPEFIMLKKK
jgi:ABC-type transport system substrate-binding protein